MVTAETALVLPLVAAFTLAMAYLVSLGIDQVRLVDASRDAARAVASGASVASAEHEAVRTAPAGADVQVDDAGGLVEVTVRSRFAAPSWLLVPIPGVTLTAHASVQAEESDATP
jgi:hypothetical protein